MFTEPKKNNVDNLGKFVFNGDLLINTFVVNKFS